MGSESIKQEVEDLNSYYMLHALPKRKPNWTATEQNRMLDLYASYKDVLGSKHMITARSKAECWGAITLKLNEGNTGVMRSVDEVKRKWHNLVGQGRRDFYDWKRLQQYDKNTICTMPARSCKALELFFNSKFENWKNQTDDLQWDDGSNQDDCEIRNFDLNDPETFDHEQLAGKNPFAPSRPGSTPANAKVQVKEKPGTSVLPASALVTHLSSSASETMSRIPSTYFQDTVMQEPPQVQVVWRANPAASRSSVCQNTVSASKDSVSHVQVKHELETIAASASLNQISLESLHQPPITTATIPPSSSPIIDPLLASSSSHSQESSSPPPEEPARKKRRISETVQSQHEAELRMDILQLEKDKLWLETEKLRLEIDILRKQKRQIDN